MPSDFELTFPPATASFVKDTYLSGQLIVEYGSGGSTFLAGQAKKSIISVETDREWYEKLADTIASQQLCEFITPLHADIGETENWGYPSNDDHWRQWATYPSLPWQYCETHKLTPDVVLIDGRFRVASFLACCTFAQKPLTLLFDDYVDREHYHVVEAIAPYSTIIDERMAVFTITPQMINARELLTHIDYFSVTD